MLHLHDMNNITFYGWQGSAVFMCPSNANEVISAQVYDTGIV